MVVSGSGWCVLEGVCGGLTLLGCAPDLSCGVRDGVGVDGVGLLLGGDGGEEEGGGSEEGGGGGLHGDGRVVVRIVMLVVVLFE